MPYTPTVWTDEVPNTTPVKYKITDDTSGVLANSAKIEVVTSITPGTSVCAANLNKLEGGVEDAQAAADAAQADADAAQAAAEAAQAAAEAAQADVDDLDFPTVSTASGISTDTTSTSYVTMTGSSISPTLTSRSNIIVTVSGLVTSGSGDDEYFEVVVNEYSQPGGEVIARIAAGQIYPITFSKTVLNVPAGAAPIYVRFKSKSGNQVNFYNGSITALVIPVVS